MDFWGDDEDRELWKEGFSQRIRDLVKRGRRVTNEDGMTFVEIPPHEFTACPTCDEPDADLYDAEWMDYGYVFDENNYFQCAQCGNEWDITYHYELEEGDLIPVGQKLGEAFWGDPIPPALW